MRYFEEMIQTAKLILVVFLMIVAISVASGVAVTLIDVFLTDIRL